MSKGLMKCRVVCEVQCFSKKCSNTISIADGGRADDFEVIEISDVIERISSAYENLGWRWIEEDETQAILWACPEHTNSEFRGGKDA